MAVIRPIASLIFVAASYTFLGNIAAASPPDLSKIAGFLTAADVVCVGTVDSTVLTDAKAPVVSHYDYRIVSTQVHPVRYLVGTPETSDLTVDAYAIDTRRGGTFGGYRDYFTDFVAGKSYLLFLHRETQGHYTLVNPNNFSQSAIPVSPSLPGNSQKSPLAQIIEILVESTTAPDKDVRWPALYYLGDVAATYATAPSGTGGDASTVVKLEAVPAIVRLTKDPDDRIRAEALFQAAQSQVASAIAAAQQMAVGSSPYAEHATEALGQYVGGNSVQALETVMRTGVQPAARSEAAIEIRTLGTTHSIPALLAALQDRDEGVRYQAVEALSTITGIPAECSENDFSTHESEFQRFWKEWAAKHAEELKLVPKPDDGRSHS